MRTELESGGWVEHRPYEDLKGKDRKAVSLWLRRRLPLAADGSPDLPGLEPGARAELEDTLKETAWARVLTGWSFDLPLPAWAEGDVVNRESFGELPAGDFAEIEALLAPFYAAMVRQASPKGPPTATTSSSNGSSRARAASSRTG